MKYLSNLHPKDKDKVPYYCILNVGLGQKDLSLQLMGTHIAVIKLKAGLSQTV